MATYTVITAAQIDPESVIDATLAGQWSENAEAMFEKAAGAPVLANDYIVQAMVSKTPVSLAGTLTASDYTYITLSRCSFFPMIHAIGGSATITSLHPNITDLADPQTPTFGFYNSDVNTGTYDVDYEYITI